MIPADIVRISIALRKDFKQARKRGEQDAAPLTAMIDDLQSRYLGFTPKYEAYGRTLRPYASRLGIELRKSDLDLHQWITENIENLRKGSAPVLSNLIVCQIAETRPDYLIELVSKITDNDAKLSIAEFIDNMTGLSDYRDNKQKNMTAKMKKDEPENRFHRNFREDFNLRDWEIAAQRILLERKRKTGVLDLSKLRIDSLPDSVGDLMWLRDLSCSVTAITKIDGLHRFENLEILHCSYGKLRELPSLRGCTKLAQITCGVTDIDSIAHVADCPSLERLYCGSTYVSDLTPLRSCSSLTILRCEDTRVSDLAGVEACKELRILDCSDTAVKDLTPLDDLGKLETLFLSGCHIEQHSADLWLAPSLNEVFFCRGSLEGVPSHILSRSFDENCLPRLREFYRNADVLDK